MREETKVLISFQNFPVIFSKIIFTELLSNNFFKKLLELYSNLTYLKSKSEGSINFKKAGSISRLYRVTELIGFLFSLHYNNVSASLSRCSNVDVYEECLVGLSWELILLMS